MSDLLGEALFEATQQGRRKVALDLVRNPETNVNWTEYGITPLYLCAKSGDHELVSWLLKRGDLDLNLDSFPSLNPLIAACEMGEGLVTDVLIADRRLHPHLRAFGEAWKGFTNESKKSQRKGDFLQIQGALTGSCLGGKLNQLKEILNQEKVDLCFQGTGGKTPLQFACSGGSLEVVEHLLTIPGAHLNLPDEYGRSPFFNSCFKGKCDLVKAFIRVGGDFIDFNQMDLIDRTPFFAVCEDGSVEIMKIL